MYKKKRAKKRNSIKTIDLIELFFFFCQTFFKTYPEILWKWPYDIVKNYIPHV